MPPVRPIYLDNNSTTPLDPRVLARMLPVLEEHFGNPASSTHPYGWFAEELVTIAREEVSAFVGAKPEEVVFTSGGTEANNLAILGAVSPGSQHVISCVTEHRSVLDPLRYLQESGTKVTLLPVDVDGRFPLDALASAITPETTLVSLMLANNEIGTVQPLREVSALTSSRGLLLHCDAVQAAGKLPIDVGELGVDLLSLGAHKFYGPKGVGALVVRNAARERLRPQMFGGGHEGGLRSGTLNVAGIVGMGAAAALSVEAGEAEIARVADLTDHFYSTLKARIPGTSLIGPKTRLPGNLNVSFLGAPSAQLIGRLQTKLAFSAGSACQSHETGPSHVLRALGLPTEVLSTCVRFGIGRFTTREELEQAAILLEQAVLACRR